MLKKSVKINLSNGFHIRPATKFIKKAKKFLCNIQIKLKNNIVDAKSLLQIQTLGISNGDNITIITDGIDEFKALNSLVNLIKSLKE